MKLHLRKTIVTTVAIMGLSACAQTQREVAPRSVEPGVQPSVMAGEAVAEEGFQEWALVVEGLPIGARLQDRAAARGLLLDMLEADLTDEQLAEVLATAKEDGVTAADLREALGGSDSLSGIAGFSALQFLEAYVTGVTQKVRGKIRQYYFNDDQKGGYLEVDTVVDTLQGGSVVHTDKYFWAIAIRPKTFQVIDRVDSSPNDPFPNTVVFPPQALNTSNPDSIWGRHLDQKLWAKGTGIVVIAIRKNDMLLPLNYPWYQSSPDSCIDLMFWGYPRTSELPPQRFYCLGRCKHPQVVNTD